MHIHSTDRPGLRVRIASSFLALMLVAGWSGCSNATPDPDASRATAARFLDEIRDGRVEAAWDGTSTEFKSLLGREALVNLVRAHPTLREKEPAEFISFNTAERNGLPLAECAFRSASKKSAIKVLLARENGTWKVERLTVD